MKKKTSVLWIIAAFIFGVGLTACVAGVYFSTVFGGGESLASAKRFAEIYGIIEQKFVGDVEMAEVTDTAYRAMVEATGDEWSYYMTAEELGYYQEYQQNSYRGIGITIEPDEATDYLRVKIVSEDSPASKAGITIGDRIMAINDTSLEGMTANQVKTVIGETDGAEFKLTVLSREDEERVLTLSTELVFSDPVKYELLEDGIGYIRIKNFENKSGSGAIAAVKDLLEQGAQGIVFDVRGNPGGLLNELTTILDYLLPEGDMFVSVSRNGVEQIISSDAQCLDIPMVVLIDGNSYSAAEFFAAALSEYDMAQLVGSPTTGKSRSQVNLMLSKGGAVHLSTNGYLTPKRVDLAAQGGLSPDYVVEFTEEQADYHASGLLPLKDDGQFIKALDLLRMS